MKVIEGQKYQFSGFQVTTDRDQRVSRVFAVFAEKGTDPNHPPRRSPKEMLLAMNGKAEECLTRYFSVENLLSAILSPNAFILSKEPGAGHLKEVVLDINNNDLKDVLKAMSDIKIAPCEAGAEYYVPAHTPSRSFKRSS